MHHVQLNADAWDVIGFIAAVLIVALITKPWRKSK